MPKSDVKNSRRRLVGIGERSAREIVEGVAGEQIGQRRARRFPVAQQVGATRDADALGGAKIFEVGDGDRIGGAAFGPGGGVDGVAGFATAHEQIEAVLPEAVVNETDGD